RLSVKEAGSGRAGHSVSVLNGAEGRGDLTAGLVAQGLTILDSVKRNLAASPTARAGADPDADDGDGGGGPALPSGSVGGGGARGPERGSPSPPQRSGRAYTRWAWAARCCPGGPTLWWCPVSEAAGMPVLIAICMVPAVAWIYLLAAHGGYWRTGCRLPVGCGDAGTGAGDWPSVVAVIPARDEA